MAGRMGMSLALALLLGAAIQVRAGGQYGLSWSTVDAGGKTFSTGSAYSLGGTAGQPDAGVLSAGPYQVAGGFWSATTSAILPTATPAGPTFTPTATHTPGGVRVPASSTSGLLPVLLSAIFGGIWLASASRDPQRSEERERTPLRNAHTGKRPLS